MLGLFGGVGAIFSFLSGLAPSIAQVFVNRSNVEEQEFQAASTADAQVQGAVYSSRTAVLATLAGQIMMLAFGLPTALHWGWTMVTATFPQWGFHTDPLGGQYAASEHDIAMSFFVVAPATTALAVFSMMRR